jgi:sulfur carrier protein
VTPNPTIQIRLNGEPHEVPEGLTAAQLVDSLGLAPELVAIEINAELCPKSARDSTPLASGDRVELVTLVGGG